MPTKKRLADCPEIVLRATSMPTARNCRSRAEDVQARVVANLARDRQAMCQAVP